MRKQGGDVEPERRRRRGRRVNVGVDRTSAGGLRVDVDVVNVLVRTVDKCPDGLEFGKVVVKKGGGKDGEGD